MPSTSPLWLKLILVKLIDIGMKIQRFMVFQGVYVQDFQPLEYFFDRELHLFHVDRIGDIGNGNIFCRDVPRRDLLPQGRLYPFYQNLREIIRARKTKKWLEFRSDAVWDPALILYQICTFSYRQYAKYLILFTPCTACTGRTRKPWRREYAIILISYRIKKLPSRFEWHSWGVGSTPISSTSNFKHLDHVIWVFFLWIFGFYPIPISRSTGDLPTRFSPWNLTLFKKTGYGFMSIS